MWLLIALIVAPLIEIVLFIQIGGLIGVWATILVVLVTAALGASLLRRQGLQTMAKVRAELERGGDPSPQLAHGALQLMAGVLLLVPGFFTDAIGLALLVPSVRDAVIGWIAPRLSGRTIRFGVGGVGPGGAPRGPTRAGPGDPPIEAEYREIAPEDPDRKG